MATIIAVLEKQLAELALTHLPLVVLLIAAVVVLAVIVAARYNKKVNDIKADRETQRLIIKQQSKLIRLLSAVPCVSKRNATQLADPKQSGDYPDQPECSYLKAVDKGEV